MDPRVSVIVPAYNAEKYIRRALRSALAQTYGNLEVVVVDDGSTDATPDVVRGVGDPRILLVRQENSGQGRARNEGIRRSSGDLITFLDADDYYLQEKVEKQVRFLQSAKEFDVVYCNAVHFYARWPSLFFKREARGHEQSVLATLLHGTHINPNAVMMKRTVLEQVGLFNETRYYPEDWEMWLRVALAGFRFGYLDEDLVVVEVREDSNTTMDIQPMLKQHAIDMIERVLPPVVEVNGRTYRREETIRDLQMKKALACLMVGRRREYLHTVARIHGRAILPRLVALCMSVCPPGVVRFLWRLNQVRNSLPVRRPAGGIPAG